MFSYCEIDVMIILTSVIYYFLRSLPHQPLCGASDYSQSNMAVMSKHFQQFQLMTPWFKHMYNAHAQNAAYYNNQYAVPNGVVFSQVLYKKIWIMVLPSGVVRSFSSYLSKIGFNCASTTTSDLIKINFRIYISKSNLKF